MDTQGDSQLSIPMHKRAKYRGKLLASCSIATLCLGSALLFFLVARKGDETKPLSVTVDGVPISSRWEAALHDALRKATRLRVRSGGTCHRNESEENTLFETKNPADVQSLLAAIKIDEQKSGFH